MGGSIFWRGGTSGAWSVGQNWSVFRDPSLSDDAGIGAGDTVEIAAGVLAQAAALMLPGTLLLDAGATLHVVGTIAPTGGTFSIAGTVEGGTLAEGGTLLFQGGTLDGTVVQGGFSGLGDVTITKATVAANDSSPIAPGGTLTLAAGRYDDASFSLTATGSGLDAGTGGTVLLGATTQITGTAAASMLGGFALTSQGTIALTQATQAENETVYQPTGKYHSLVATPLSWTQATAPTLDISATLFVNTGLVTVTGGTLDFSGASVRNTGTITLADTTAQTAEANATGTIVVVATTLTTSIEVAASVTDFTNAGTIAADAIRFDTAVQLSRLGTLTGAVTFAGTLDLGGKTLAATAASPVMATGTVLHGSLAAGRDDLSLAGATLRGVILASGTATASGTLALGGLGALTLDAGAVLSANGTVALAGPTGDVLHNNGTIAAGPGATLLLAAGLGGAGTVELGNEAAVTVNSLALFAKPTFLFDPGAALLTIAGHGAGVTLADLHAGDVLDFSALSSAGAGHAFACAANGALDVIGASGQSALVALSSPAQGLGFSVGADGHGGTTVTVS